MKYHAKPQSFIVGVSRNVTKSTGCTLAQHSPSRTCYSTTEMGLIRIKRFIAASLLSDSSSWGFSGKYWQLSVWLRGVSLMPAAKTTEPREKSESLTEKMSFDVSECTLPNVGPRVGIEYSWALSQNHHVPPWISFQFQKKEVCFICKQTGCNIVNVTVSLL